MHYAIRRDAREGRQTMAADLLDEIERLQKENEQLRKAEAIDFWCNIVFPNGATAEDIQNELIDYYTILGEVSKVYDHITGGMISNQNTLAEDVIAMADEYYQKLYEDEEAIADIDTIGKNLLEMSLIKENHQLRSKLIIANETINDWADSAVILNAKLESATEVIDFCSQTYGSSKAENWLNRNRKNKR